MANLRDTYNRIAEEWHKDHQQDDWWQEGTDRFAGLLEPGARVLDVGCGGGTKSKYLIAKGFEVLGVDLAENMVAIAKREVPEAKFQTLSMYDVDTLEGEFDGIFSQASLLHIPKRDVFEVLRKLANKLRAGGYLYIAVKEMRPGGVEEEVVTEHDYGYPYERFFSYFSAEELMSILQDLGMEIVFNESKPTGKTSWLQIIARK